jgi:hypothetical protein
VTRDAGRAHRDRIEVSGDLAARVHHPKVLDIEIKQLDSRRHEAARHDRAVDCCVRIALRRNSFRADALDLTVGPPPTP